MTAGQARASLAVRAALPHNGASHSGDTPLRTYSAHPHPALRPYIDRYWSWEASPGETIALPRLLPGTGAELFLHHGRSFQCADGAVLPVGHMLCVRHTPLTLAPTPGVAFTAIRVRAGQWGALVREPLGHWLDARAPLDALWGHAAQDWLEQVGQADGFAQRAALIDAFLLTRLAAQHADAQMATAVAQLYAAPHATTIDTLATRLQLSRRQLERRFLAVEGLSPVTFRRLARFQRTVRALHLQADAPLLDTLLTHGYYDQPQFNREFRTLTGQTPRQYRAAAGATHFYKTTLA